MFFFDMSQFFRPFSVLIRIIVPFLVRTAEHHRRSVRFWTFVLSLYHSVTFFFWRLFLNIFCLLLHCTAFSSFFFCFHRASNGVLYSSSILYGYIRTLKCTLIIHFCFLCFVETVVGHVLYLSPFCSSFWSAWIAIHSYFRQLFLGGFSLLSA